MAEFKYVMQQLRRARLEHNLEDSPLFSPSAKGTTDDMLDQCEQEVLNWAKEHPEQRYPTWYDWLFEIGAIDIENALITSLGKRIPKDIAEAHNIKPINGE